MAKNCSFCHNESSTESPVCYFLVGFVNGMVDYLYGKPHTATETRCGGMGGELCEIEITELRPATEEKLGRVAIESEKAVNSLTTSRLPHHQSLIGRRVH